MSAAEAKPAAGAVRYDRQLRLWGDHGQARLGAASVCLVGVTGTGCEALKSLVLPGIASFTVVDHRNVAQRHLGTNFFLTLEDVGRPLAEAAKERLAELNPAVEGKAIVAELDDSSDLAFLSSHSLAEKSNCDQVILSGVSETLVLAVDALLQPLNVPLMVVRSFGLLGYCRLSVRQHCAVETHPENPAPDLRLHKPFPELQAHVDAIDLGSLSHEAHSHTPYAVLLFKALAAWRTAAAKDGPHAMPADYQERKAVKAILEGMRMADDKGRLDEENFAEAAAAANRALVRPQLSAHLRDILRQAPDRLKDCGDDNRSFWCLAAGLRRWVEREGEDGLPVTGALPDMFSSSEGYLGLQRLYHAKAREDAAALRSLALEELEMSGGGKGWSISETEAERFARNAAHLRLCASKPMAQELSDPDSLRTALQSEPAAAAWLLCLKAAEKFAVEKNRYPGTNGIPIELDAQDLLHRVKTLGAKLGLEEEVEAAVTEAHVKEMCRYGGAEIHAVAAWMGGVAAQEAVKLLTRQYVPLHNALLFDATTQTAAVFTL